jgi:putative ABC transport system permease protein
MFRYLSLAMKNSTRNRRRSLLTICSMAVSLCLLGVLFAMYAGLFLHNVSQGSALRMVVRHKVSLAQTLPYAYEGRIRQVPGVREISSWNWFQGAYKDQREPKNFFARFAVEPRAFLTIRTQMDMPDDQRKAFVSERTACVVSKDLAERLGFKLGDRITIVGDIYPVTLELTVRGIFDDPDAINTLFFNREYLRDMLTPGRRDQEGTFAVLVASPDDIPRVSSAIDNVFDNSPQPTKTESEQQFAQTFASFIGNIKMFLFSICAAVTFTILLVSGNTMAMSVRERIKEVGVLKTLGYTTQGILSIILEEAAVISVIGGVVGVLLAELLILFVRKTVALYQPALHDMAISIPVGLICVALALVIGLASSFVPAWNAARTNILDSLRYAG